MDAGEPLTLLAGIHPGCFELFGNERIRTIADLKGKSVGVQALGSSQHVFLASMATYVGLDPVKDINWVASASPKPMELYAEGKIDAFLGFPPEPQELRARQHRPRDRQQRLGPTLVAILLLHAGRQHGVHPATIRSRPSACCAPCSKAPTYALSEPERVARQLVDDGFTKRSRRTPARRSTKCPTASGASTTPRTRSGSTRFGCTRRA